MALIENRLKYEDGSTGGSPVQGVNARAARSTSAACSTSAARSTMGLSSTGGSPVQGANARAARSTSVACSTSRTGSLPVQSLKNVEI